MNVPAPGEVSPSLDSAHYFMFPLHSMDDVARIELQHPEAHDFLQSVGITTENIKFLLATNFDQEVGPAKEFPDYNTRIVDGVEEKVLKEHVRLWGDMTIPGVAGAVEVAGCTLFPLREDYPDRILFRFPINGEGDTETPSSESKTKPTLGFEIIHVLEGSGSATFLTDIDNGDLTEQKEVDLVPGSVIIMRSGTARKIRTNTDCDYMQLRHTSNMEWKDTTMATIADVTKHLDTTDE